MKFTAYLMLAKTAMAIEGTDCHKDWDMCDTGECCAWAWKTSK